MSERRSRQRSAGELAAYQMGLELGSQANTRSRRVVRRQVQVSEHEVVFIEEEIWEEESHWER
jgi:hypothetical protein